jgi:hypothetical protein
MIAEGMVRSPDRCFVRHLVFEDSPGSAALWHPGKGPPDTVA